MSHICLKLYLCTEKTSENPTVSSPVDLEALHKQEVKAQARLYTAFQSIKGMLQQAYRDPQQSLRDLFVSRS